MKKRIQTTIGMKRNVEAMHTNATYAVYITASLLCAYFLCGMIFLSYSWLIMFIYHIKEPALPIFIPKIDYNTKSGFIITSSYQYLVLYLGVAGLGFCDALFLNLVFSVLAMSDLICIKLSTICEIKMMSELRAQLRNIFIMHKEMER